MQIMDMIRTKALAAWGEKAARDIKAEGTTPGWKEALRVRWAMEQLRETAAQPDASEWYADNLYLARREALRAAEAFRRAGRLQKAGGGAVVSALCEEFTAAGELTEQRLGLFLQGARRGGLIPESEAGLVSAGLALALLRRLGEGEAKDAARLFTDLRRLGDMDLTEALEQSDPLDAMLRQDRVYPLMDEASRAAYRRRCGSLARRKGQTPEETVRQAMEQGLHGSLFPPAQRSGWLYMAAHVLFTLALALSLALRSGSWLAGCLLVLPLSELVRTLMDAMLLRGVKPRPLMRMALEDGLGSEGRCVCAMSVLLTSEKDGPDYARRMEQFRLANRDCGEHLLFALLADLPEGAQYPPEGGPEALAAAEKALKELNERYGGGFYLLSREAVWNETDKCWMPWERKRGAVTELARLLQGRSSALRCLVGREETLRAPYILTLDADTRLVPGSARKLLGAAMHPLNRPVVERGVVVRGHGIFHPRMAVELSAAMATDFARIHLGQGGTDPYSAPSSELMFDLFGRGGFSGKGVIDAACYLECLDGRIPEGRVLSHDAIEGAYLRGAYVGDTELSDLAPVSAEKWFARLQRWTRGDWQNLPWLFRRGRDLSPVDRWRLLDSLRRSLVAPAALGAILLGLYLPSFRLCAWAALGCLGGQVVLDALSRLFSRAGERRLRCRSGVLRGLGGSLARLLFRLLFLPWEAYTCVMRKRRRKQRWRIWRRIWTTLLTIWPTWRRSW